MCGNGTNMVRKPIEIMHNFEATNMNSDVICMQSLMADLINKMARERERERQTLEIAFQI